MRLVGSYESAIALIKSVLLWVGVALALVAAIDWAVRTRRISPFNRVARFFRGTIDPLYAPVERIVVRAGGLPYAAPWWTLVAYAVFSILLIWVLGFVAGFLYQVAALGQNPSEAWRVILSWVFGLLQLALLVRVISSWLPVSPRSRWVRWSFVLTDWMIIPLRRVVPTVGMLDITPLVAWIGLILLERIILS